MHIWPSTVLRDSFKVSYLKKVEWNLNRMNSEKKRSPVTPSNRQKLLGNQDGKADADEADEPLGVLATIWRELLVLSCFCCGAYVIDQEGN